MNVLFQAWNIAFRVTFNHSSIYFCKKFIFTHILYQWQRKGERGGGGGSREGQYTRELSNRERHARAATKN